jgi:predicted transposase YdaD
MRGWHGEVSRLDRQTDLWFPMPHRFDAILKHLPEQYPQDWALLAGVPRSVPVKIIDAEISTVTAAADDSLWTATFILMGLEYDQAVARQLLRGVRIMKESVTYQAILEEVERKDEKRVGKRRGKKHWKNFAVFYWRLGQSGLANLR